MPAAALKAGPELSIQLDNVGGPHHPCQAGDMITGRVTRGVPGVSPRITISLRLLGRAKTKITVTRSNGQSTSRSHYRNRYNFFETTQTRQFLHDGPMHITPAGGGGGGVGGGAAAPVSWPFALQVPLHPSPRAVLSEGGNADISYLSLTPEDIAAAPLPASFLAYGRHGNTRFETYVEYHLEAELMDSGSHSKGVVTAVMPIRMRDAYTPPPPTPLHPLADSALQRRLLLPGAVSTYRLVPGMETTELSFKQKTKQFLGSSKVPVFGFRVQVDCPTVIQLGGAAPVPFAMRIVPDERRTSELVHDVDQTVSLNYLELVLKAHTATLAPTTFGVKRTEDTLKHTICLPVMALGKMINPQPDSHSDPQASSSSSSAAAQRRPIGVVIPSSWDVGGKETTALNIGAAMDLRLFPTHATALGQTIARTGSQGPIYPAFTTYCIQHTAMLKWKAEIEIAGKTEKFESQQAVTIIGPSEPEGHLPPVAAAAQRSEKSAEQLPSYGETESAAGGPSARSGAADALMEDLPVYTR